MDIRSPAHLARLIASQAMPIFVRYRSGAKEIKPVYGTSKPAYAWAIITEEEGKLIFTEGSPLAECRGWAYESLLISMRKLENEKVYGMSVSPKIADYPLTCFITTGSNVDQLRKGVEILNYYEQKARWFKTRLISTQNPLVNLLVGSKNWKRNLPLISAFLLIPRTFSQWTLGTEETLKGYYERISTKCPTDVLVDNMPNDAAAFRLIIEDDLLFNLMRHSRYVSGKSPYEHVNSKTYVHNTGAGDFAMFLKFLKQQREKGVFKSPEEYQPRFDNGSPKFWNFSETAVTHGRMIERLLDKLNEKSKKDGDTSKHSSAA